MEENLLTSAVKDQDGVEVDDLIYNDGTSFGGERCGICMDIIIDRGVLDCCQHWFCFGCIDNWATITNLCPLCQNEFQLITCVPVYDTIGSSKNDDDSYSRDDDWFIEGKNNTLSFPSYYIDENAVICLDGDGCKIRNGLAAVEGDSNLDTSIACDSCDLWYHASCVGFDPESTSENTWLCPRCVVDEMPQKSDGNLGKNYNNLSGSENSNRDQLVEDTYSRKMSVSVADSGETALVVSMVEGDKLAEEPLDNIGQAVEVNKDLKTQAFMLTSEDDGQKQITPSEEKSVAQPILKTRELELSLSCDTSLSASNCLIKKELVTIADKSVNDHSSSLGIKSSEEFSNELCISSNPSGSSSDMGLRLCLSVGSFLSEVNKSVTGDQMNEGLDQLDPTEECKPTAEKSVPEVNEDLPVTSGVKRKHLDYSTNMRDDTHGSHNGNSKTEIENEATPNKMRSDERTRPISPIDQVNISASNDSKITSPEQNNGTADIMSIIQGTKRRPSKGPKCTSTGDKPKEVENSGLRMKKIMKRVKEGDRESSTVVQNLRKQIREAVRNNKSVKDLGEENLFDPKLLAAFRAAVSVPKTEPNKALSQLGVKVRKSMLQKGKVRENLTKKIYGSSNGRRKRAWDRDCEVEFWKHRCLRASRPEKIQTLESVLDLLRNESEGMENGQRSKDPILSRLYLADTSVFPRKDDIKPLASLKTSGDSEPCNNKQNEKRLKSSLDSSNCQVIDSSKVEKKSLKSVTREEKIVKPPDVKVDKRKWALEVLARRTGDGAGDRSASERNEDNAVLNYPLLAQLPVEMRPVLAVSRHNKIPMSLRQAQLYRLTEHLLRKANLLEIRRNAETELAVADAINIEREVSDRSNSKPVYINLCAQELLLHRSETPKPREEEDPQPVEDVPEQSGTELSTGPTVEEALRNAGLISDSPPNSPEDEGPEDVFEIDNVPDLDIFGEFEYSLDEEDYIGNSSTSQVSKVQQNPEECGSKLKLVFSTLGSDKPESELPNSAEPRVPEEGSLSLLGKEGEEVSIAECEELYGPDKEPSLIENLMDESMKLGGLGDEKPGSVGRNSSAGECSPNRFEMVENARKKVEKKSSVDNSISKKVEAYVKEHVRPLCKSGIITADQYRWAVAKTTEKVMKYHSKAKNANFLIKEGEKVKRLSEQYVEAAKQKDKTD